MISRSHFSFNTNAIFVNNSPRLMLEIENCSFRYNIAQKVNQDRGAGIYVHSVLVFQLSSSIFQSNFAIKASSLYYILPQLSVNNFELFTDKYENQISIKNNTFSDNVANFISGGLYFTMSEALDNDFFWFNQRFQTLNYTDPGQKYMKIAGNKFIRNKVELLGSCIRINGYHKDHFDTVELYRTIYQNNEFINNSKCHLNKYYFNKTYKYQ